MFMASPGVSFMYSTANSTLPHAYVDGFLQRIAVVLTYLFISLQKAYGKGQLKRKNATSKPRTLGPVPAGSSIVLAFQLRRESCDAARLFSYCSASASYDERRSGKQRKEGR